MADRTGTVGRSSPRAASDRTTFGLQEDAARSPLMVLADYLREKTLLLVLDNCEHVIDACAQLAEHLLLHCPTLRILATSREALGIDGEAALRVPSLSLPAVDTVTREALSQSEAAQLFIERAAAALPGFALTDTNGAAIANPTNSDGLKNDHPVNMAYNPTADTGLEPIATVQTSAVKLYADGTNQTVQCASCHTVHDNTNSPFLRVVYSSAKAEAILMAEGLIFSLCLLWF